MERPTLTASVVIGVKNRPVVLEALRALSRQSASRGDFDVVLVDLSDDGTSEQIRQASYPFELRHLVTSRPGKYNPAWVRNRGLEQARGDIVVFMDADLIPGPDFVREHLAAHAAHPSAVVLGTIFGYPWGQRTPEVMGAPPPEQMLARLPALLQTEPGKWSDTRLTAFANWPNPYPWLLSGGSNSSFPRALVRQVGGYDEAMEDSWGAEDLELAYRLHLAGARHRFAPFAWGCHYPHPIAPDLGTAGQRYRRYFLRKHPHAMVEHALWGWTLIHAEKKARRTAPKGAWDSPEELTAFRHAVRAVVQAEQRAAPTSPACAQAILERLGVSGGARVAWFGELPEGLPQPPAKHYRPGAAEGSGLPSLWGFSTEFEDGALDAVVFADAWRRLPRRALEYLFAEGTRIGRRVLLLQFDPARGPALRGIEEIPPRFRATPFDPPEGKGWWLSG